MKAEEAAELIRAMGESLKRDPAQFNFRVLVAGTVSTVQGGGRGISVEVSGGEPGSSTYGYVSSVDAGNIQIQRGQADAAATEAILETAETLRALAEAVGDGDKRGADLLLDRLQKGTAVPGVILSAASVALKLAEVTA